MDVKDIISSGLLELYVAGIATDEEVVQVQQWALQYPEVKEELAQIELSMEVLALANAVEPGASVKQRIMSSINEQPSVTEVGSSIKPAFNTQHETARLVSLKRWKLVAAAAAVLLLISAALNFVQLKDSNQLKADLAQTKSAATQMQEQAAMMEQNLQVVQSKYSQPVALSGLNTLPDAAAKVFWMKNTGDVYVDPSNLPQPPGGKQYELWAIVDGKPVNAGIIVTTRKGNHYVIQKMKTIGNVQAFAISLEQSNPVPAAQPTEVVVMGKM